LTEPLVSIVMPLYNHRPYVEESLASLTQQPGVRMEVLVIDDGSTDGGGDVAEAWLKRNASRFERVWFSKQSNAGVSTTLRRLLAEAQGDVIQPLASDDQMLPGVLASRLDLLRRSGLEAMVGDFKPFEGATIGSVVRCGPRRGGPRLYAWWLLTNWNLAAAVMMFQKGAVTYPEGLAIDDRWAALQLAARGTIGYQSGAVMAYRIHATNSVRSRASRLAQARALERAASDAVGGPAMFRVALRYDAFRMHALVGRWRRSLPWTLAFLTLSGPWLLLRLAVRGIGGKARQPP
jgi:alpha-1,3-rhamnosyltransferase